MKIEKHTSQEELYKTDRLASYLLTSSYQNNLPIALWRKPQEKSKHAVVGFVEKTPRHHVDLEELSSGFIARKFENKDTLAWFIPSDLYINFDDEVFREGNDRQLNVKEQEIKESFFKNLRGNIQEKYTSSSFYEGSLRSSTSERHQDFEQEVQKAIEKINQGAFKKVVLSRNKQVELNSDFDPIETFHKLCEAYPAAFISLISIPEVGTWMGASPEILIQIDQDQIFKTIALAGTQARGNLTPAEAAWRQKEIEEQALVGRYIINCFKKIRLREYEEYGPKTFTAGHLYHLCSEFVVDMKKTNFPQLGTVMLELLHPTSAVCGMPKDQALDFIHEEEGYNRQLFSGFIGPVNMGGSTDIYVNLRCMQLFKNSALLYAGAGITWDSEAEKEWNETEIKMDTMLKLIQ